MSSSKPTRPDALTALRERKAAVRTQLHESAQLLKSTTQGIFAPPKATNKLEAFMNLFDQGVAIYDGVLLGMRVVRNLQRVFGRRR